ncbi:hypothetical protein DRB06_13120 [Actinomyces sp. Z5]|nr:hypothetical protein DRB06_13120 [Actinomyces sp. Z5]
MPPCWHAEPSSRQVRKRNSGTRAGESGATQGSPPSRWSRRGAEDGAMSEVPPTEPPADQPQDRAPSPGAGQPEPSGGPVPPPGTVPADDMPPGAAPPGGVPPQGAFPPDAGAPVPPHRPASAGFFESLRRTGLVRTNERWIGGVAGGVARRLGLDPTLVRCIWLVLTIFSGIGLVLYGLGWALMPEESDDRIHLEQAVGGDFDAGLAGALATFIAGWVLLDHGLVPSWYITGLAESDLYNGFWPVVWTCLMVGLVYWAYRVFQRRQRQKPPAPGSPGSPTPGAGMPYAAPPAAGPQVRTPPPGAPAAHATPYAAAARAAGGADGAVRADAAHNAPAGMPGPTASGPTRPMPAQAGAGHAATRPTAAPGTPASAARRPTYVAPRPVRPVRPRRPGPSRRLGLAIMGIACCCIAVIVLTCSTGSMGPLAAGFAMVGTVTALLGAGVIISALRGRRGGWMTATGWLAVMVAVPVLAIGTSMPEGALSARSTTRGGTTNTVTLTWADLEPQLTAADGNANVVSLGDYAVGSIVLDLRDMPAGAEPHTRARLSVGVGEVTVRTVTGQNLAVDAEVGMGEFTADFKDDWLVDGQPVSDGGYWQEARFRVDGSSVNNYAVARLSMDETSSVVSPAARASGTALMLDIEMGTGEVRVAEQPSEVTWYGNQNNEVWIVWYWVDANGNSHDGLPVPGMTHDAIDSDTADICAEAAEEARNAETAAEDGSEDADPYEDDYWDGSWYDVSNLTGAGREAWDNCVSEALEAGAAADGQAEPSAPASAQPSDEPSAGPSTSSSTAEPTPTPTH